jgi:hypothetical protein
MSRKFIGNNHNDSKGVSTCSISVFGVMTPAVGYVNGSSTYSVSTKSLQDFEKLWHANKLS